jgi:hypothetical protein
MVTIAREFRAVFSWRVATLRNRRLDPARYGFLHSIVDKTSKAEETRKAFVGFPASPGCLTTTWRWRSVAHPWSMSTSKAMDRDQVPRTGRHRLPGRSAGIIASTAMTMARRIGLPLFLFRWTRMIAVRTEYAAISRQGLEESLAAFAFVEVLAGIGRHCLSSAVATGRTRDGARELDHCCFTNAAA